MSMQRRDGERQADLWIAAGQVVVPPGNPFYKRLNTILIQKGFDAFVEALCEKFYVAGKGRPGIEPGVYFRMLLMRRNFGFGSPRGLSELLSPLVANILLPRLC